MIRALALACLTVSVLALLASAVWEPSSAREADAAQPEADMARLESADATPSRRLLLYQPLAGFGNQLMQFEIAAGLARELNRTLVVPRYVRRDGTTGQAHLSDLLQLPTPQELGVGYTLLPDAPTAITLDEVFVLVPAYLSAEQQAFLQRQYPATMASAANLTYFRDLGSVGASTALRQIPMAERGRQFTATVFASDALVVGVNMLYVESFWRPLTLHLPPHPRFCAPKAAAGPVWYNAVHVRVGDMPEYARVMALGVTPSSVAVVADKVAQLHAQQLQQEPPGTPPRGWYVASEDEPDKVDVLRRAAVPEHIVARPAVGAADEEHAILLRDVCLCWHADVFVGSSYSSLSQWIGLLRGHDGLPSYYE